MRWLWLVLFPTLAVAAPETLDRVESPVRTVDEGIGARALTEAARLCFAENVTNDAAVLRDNSRASVLAPAVTMNAGDSSVVEGGDVLKTVDLEAGLIIAQSRIHLGGLVPVVVESTITFEAKDGRFRITHTGIRRAQQYSGYMANSGFAPVYIQAGSGHAKIEQALQALSAKLGDCVVARRADW